MGNLEKQELYESFCFYRDSNYKMLVSCGFLDFCHGWDSTWIAVEIIGHLDSLYCLGWPFTVYVLKENERDYQLIFKNKKGKIMMFQRVPNPDSEFELEKNLMLHLTFNEELGFWILMFPGEVTKEIKP